MPRVSASIELRGTVYDTEMCWYDTGRWPQWVDQLAHVAEVRGDWPKQGSVVVWESGPAGRGRVTERVSQYDPRSGQATEIEDNSITGRQSVTFAPKPDGAEVHLRLDYRLKRRGPLAPLVDLLFIRRLMSASLARTLAHFQAVLEASRAQAFE